MAVEVLMLRNIVMPMLGEHIPEATITRWLKQPGDTILRDEPLFQISTDKVDAEIPSPASGVVSQLLVQKGRTVKVGTLLATIVESK